MKIIFKITRQEIALSKIPTCAAHLTSDFSILPLILTYPIFNKVQIELSVTCIYSFISYYMIISYNGMPSGGLAAMMMLKCKPSKDYQFHFIKNFIFMLTTTLTATKSAL